jgi:hypothetical protein
MNKDKIYEVDENLKGTKNFDRKSQRHKTVVG